MNPQKPVCTSAAPGRGCGAARRAAWGRALVLLLALLSPGLSAQSIAPIGNLRVVPNPAPAGLMVLARLYREGHDVAGPSTVTVEGNIVTLTVEMYTIDFTVPPPPGDFDIPLGQFAPGHYILVYAPIDPGGPYLTQRVEFDVQATPVPVATRLALLTGLALGMLLLAGVAGRRGVGGD